jgi:hypothetical protein
MNTLWTQHLWPAISIGLWIVVPLGILLALLAGYHVSELFGNPWLAFLFVALMTSAAYDAYRRKARGFAAAYTALALVCGMLFAIHALSSH